MTNVLFSFGRFWFAEGSLSWLRDDMAAMFVQETGGGGYLPVPTVDKTFQDITATAVWGDLGGQLITDAIAITTKTNVAGTVDGDDSVFNTVPATPAPLDSIIIFKRVPEFGAPETIAAAGDDVSAPDPAGLQTITLPTTLPFLATHLGGVLHVTGGTAGNDGYFQVVEFVSTSVIKIYNPAGVAETFVDPDAWSATMESPLVAYYNTGTGLPGVVPNGGNITVSWQATTPFIFTL